MGQLLAPGKPSGPCLCPQGVRNYSTPVGLDSRVLVDLVVVGSVAVSEKGKIKNRNSQMQPLTQQLAVPPALRPSGKTLTVSNFSFLDACLAPKASTSMAHFEELTPSLPLLAPLNTSAVFSLFSTGKIK